jgi:hypothetical protein
LQAQLALAKAANVSAKEQIDLSREIQALQGKVLDSKAETAAKDIALETEKNDKIKEANKKAAEDAIAARKKYNENLKSLDTEFNLTEREKLAKSFQDKADSLKGNGDLEVKLRKEIAEDKKTALDKFDADAKKKQDDIDKTILDNKLSVQSALLAIEEDSLSNRLAIQENAFNKNKAALIAQGFTAAEIEKLKIAEIKKINETYAAEEFNNQIAFINAQLKLEQDAVDLSTQTEAEKQTAKLDIQIKALEQQLALTEKYVGADGITTKVEQQGIDAIKNSLAAARKGLGEVKPDEPTFGAALGLSPEGIQEAQEGIQAITDALSKVQEIVSLRFEAQKNEIDKNEQAEIEAVNNSALNEEQKKTAINNINKKAAKERYEIAKKEFEVQKAFQVTQALIGAAQGIIQSFQLGPIAGAIAAIIVGATTAAQIAVIQSQKPPAAPGFASGVIGLNGPGTETSDSIPARLSKGESVITASGTNFAQSNYPGLLEFLNTRNRFATGVINFGGTSLPTTVNDSTERLISAISGISPIVRVTDINKKQSDYSEVRVNGTI